MNLCDSFSLEYMKYMLGLSLVCTSNPLPTIESNLYVRLT